MWIFINFVQNQKCLIMKINFEEIEKHILPHFKGGNLFYEANIYDDGINKIMRGKLVPGASIGMHTHDDSSEIIFITQGNGIVASPDGEENLKAGDCHYCAKGHAHSLINNGDVDLCFLAIVPKQ